MRFFFTVLLMLTLLIPAMQGTACASPILHSQTAVEVALVGFDGLAEKQIFKGNLEADVARAIDTSYRGLALLVFAGGQRYPLIIGDASFTVRIASSAVPPSFADSAENTFLYKALADKSNEALDDKGNVPGQDSFAGLMLQAKELLDASSSIRTLAELRAMKKKVHRFVQDNFQKLRHSDMIRRLMDQSFMMHEYVAYHVPGSPGTDIQKKYRSEVFANVAGWIKILKPYIPEPEILNYCVGLYYNRSMVTLASLIMDNFKEAAYCPGESLGKITFPDDLQIFDSVTNVTKKLADITGPRLFTFVSDQCPVSMVAAVKRGRKMVDENQPLSLIVVPMEKLSDKHRAMNRMISGSRLYFVSDEKWRQKNLGRKIRLPVSVP